MSIQNDDAYGRHYKKQGESRLRKFDDGLALLQRVAAHAANKLARFAAEHGSEYELDPEGQRACVGTRSVGSASRLLLALKRRGK